MTSLPLWWGTNKPYKICDVMDGLKGMPDGVVQCVVTSPPYWGLRQYFFDGAVIIKDNISKDEREFLEKELNRLKVIPKYGDKP